jgi:hypothetical protein
MSCWLLWVAFYGIEIEEDEQKSIRTQTSISKFKIKMEDENKMVAYQSNFAFGSRRFFPKSPTAARHRQCAIPYNVQRSTLSHKQSKASHTVANL